MLKSRIPAITIELRVLIEEVEETGAERVKADAKERVKVRTGRLQRAIHTQKEPEGTYVVAGDDEAWYGHLVEHGTTHSPPQPFLVPALEENRAEIIAMASRRMKSL